MSRLRSAFAVAMTGALLMVLPTLAAYGQDDEEVTVVYEYFVVVSKWNLATAQWEVVPPKRGPYTREEAVEVVKELRTEFPATQGYDVEIQAVRTTVVDDDGGNNESDFRVIVKKKNPATLVWEVVYRSEPFEDCESAAEFAATLEDEFPSPMYRILPPDCPADDDDDGDGGGNAGGGFADFVPQFVAFLISALIAILQSLFG